MSWSFFVALVLIGTWIILPLSMILALTQCDDDQRGHGHHS